MPLGKRQRRLLLGSGLIIMALVACWLALPLWFPWLLRPLAATQGVHYSTYTREGYSHFRLTGATLTNRTVRFSADTMEGLVPSIWLWKLAKKNNSGVEPYLLLTGWEVVSLPSSGPSPPVYSDVQNAIALFARLKTWLPVARLTNGAVHLEQTSFTVPSLNWTQGAVAGFALLPPPVGRLALRAEFIGTPPFQLEAVSDPLRLHSRIRLLPSAEGLELQSTTFWWSNQIDLYAQFARTGRVPELASLKAREFVIPPQILNLSPYPDLQGSLVAKWERDAFDLDLNAAAQPAPSQTNLPPFRLDLHARGDTNSALIQTAQLTAPWLTANLSGELVVHFHGPLLSAPAQLKLAADLSRQAWFPVKGELQGEADFLPVVGKFPRAIFQLSGSQISNQTLTASALCVAGSFDWPHLVLTNALADFADGSTAFVTADMDLAKHSIAAGDFQFNGPLGRRWLPPSCSYRDLSLSVSFDGSFEQLAHRGNLELFDFSSPFLRPVQLDANWVGQQQTIQQFQIELSAGASRLQANGGFTSAPEQMNLRLDSLSLFTNREPLLSLTQLVRIAFVPQHGLAGWQLSSSPLDWVGAGGQLRARAMLDWPRSGSVSLSVERASSSLFSGFAKDNWPKVDIRKLEAAADWSNSPATFGLEVSGAKLAPAQISTVATNSFQIVPVVSELRLHGNSDGLTISNLLVYSQTSPVLTVQGFLPLTLTPSATTNLLNVEPRKPLQLRATAEPHAFFWKNFADWTGVNLEDPQLKLQISGDWENPRGEADLRARELRLQKALPNLPTLTDLKITLQLDRNQARLLDTHLLIQGQPITLTAQLPLGPGFLTELKQKQLPNWDQASAQLLIQNAELAAFEPLFPNILSPQGSLNLDVSLFPGGKLAGELALQNARTRRLGDFGPIRDVTMKCRFLDRDLTIESVSAQISGAPLYITGHADLRGTQWLQGQLPPFALTFHGTNVPLVRQPEAVIRGDLDLSASKTNGAPPVIAGVVHLRDSFYLADLTALIPGKVAGPSRRPPYFSIEDPSLADWQLALRVDGVRFLKVRTPLFNGEVSANVVLQGTLKDPIALGDLKIDSGVVSFPFGSLQIHQGLVSLSSQDPYHPQLTVAAASKQFGYDIRMEVTGPVDDPVIQFNSTPPLSSEQILLMVTAGQLPQGTFTLTSQQRAQTMAMFLGRDLLSQIGLVDQGQERLSIRSGEEITEQGRPTYHVEYKLSNHWSLVGEYDRFGDFNAGFKWRILSR